MDGGDEPWTTCLYAQDSAATVQLFKKAALFSPIAKSDGTATLMIDGSLEL